MTQHAEQRFLPYPVEAIYNIVADVERYPEFLPWLLDATILKRTDQGFVADLTIGYKLYQDTYRSEVILRPYERIEVQYIKGPFKTLQNYWNFEAVSPQGVNVEFFIDFEFESSLFQNMIQVFFTQAIEKMVTAFEERAKILSCKTQIV